MIPLYVVRALTCFPHSGGLHEGGDGVSRVHVVASLVRGRKTRVFLAPQQILLALGRTHADAERWADAYGAYSEATTTLPKYFLVWLERGKLNAKLGRWKPAAADFANATKIGCPVERAELSGVPQLLFYESLGASCFFEALLPINEIW